MAWLSFCLTWIAVGFIACTQPVTKARPMKESGGPQCKRTLLAEGSYRKTCTYLSSWQPIRFKEEPDGIPCGLLPSTRRNHVCQNGRCVHVDDVKCPPSEEKETFTTGGPPERRVSAASTERIFIRTKDRTQHPKTDNIVENVTTLNTTENATKLITKDDVTNGGEVNENSTERTSGVGTEENVIVFGTQQYTTASVYTTIWGTNGTTENTTNNMAMKNAMNTNTENTTNTPTLKHKTGNETMTNSTQLPTTKMSIETLTTKNATEFEQTKSKINKATRDFTTEIAANGNATEYSDPKYQTENTTTKNTDNPKTQKELGYATIENTAIAIPDDAFQNNTLTNTTDKRAFKLIVEPSKTENTKKNATLRNATENVRRQPRQSYEQTETTLVYASAEAATEISVNYTRLESAMVKATTRTRMESSTAEDTTKQAPQNTTDIISIKCITEMATIKIKKETAQAENTTQVTTTASAVETATTDDECTTEYTLTENTTPYVPMHYSSRVATAETTTEYTAMKNATKNATRTTTLHHARENIVANTRIENANGKLTENCTVECATKIVVRNSTHERATVNLTTEKTTDHDISKNSTRNATSDPNVFITGNTAKKLKKGWHRKCNRKCKKVHKYGKWHWG